MNKQVKFLSIMKMKVFILLLSAAFTWAYNKTDIHIRPFSLNRRGVMGPGKVCPKNTVAIGFKMKMQHYRSMEDNSALNGIRLICSDDSQIKSSEGRKGDWTDELRCRKDDYMVGVKIKTEAWLGWDRDDLGALDFEALCSTNIRLRHRRLNTWITHTRGSWSDEVRCPQEAPAICGIKVRLDEPNHRGGLFEKEPDLKTDSAGLTEVQFKCCQP